MKPHNKIKPYKIKEMILDVDSLILRVITIDGEQFEYPIKPPDKNQKYRVKIVYNKVTQWWEIKTKEYYSLKEGKYDESTLLSIFHEPTHHDIREISPEYFGIRSFYWSMEDFEELVKNLQIIQREKCKGLYEICSKIPDLISYTESIANLLEDLFSIQILAKVKLKVKRNGRIIPLTIDEDQLINYYI